MFRPLLLCLCCLAMHWPASTAAQDRKASLFDALYEREDVRIRLTYPFDSLYRTNREEIGAVISIGHGDTWLLDTKEMTLNLRGKFRRMKCTAMPPLQLNLKKGDLRDLGLSGTDEYKLVTHCVEGEEGVENLQEERLCYQAYAAVTEYAYRTVWAEVTYCDQANPGYCYTTSGFLLESDKDIERRLGLEERKIYNVAPDSLSVDAYSNTAGFNFLIGNRDWSIIASRNAKLFYQPSTGTYISIPYDFDFSNVVGASYRRETSAKGVTHPFDRVYQGEYFNDRSAELLKAFAANEEKVLAAVRTAPNPIDEKRRDRIADYLEHGFKFIRKARPEELPYGAVCPYKGNL